MRFADVVINSVVLSDFEENAYIVSRKDSTECVVIDPGMEAKPLVKYLQDRNLSPQALLITHGHWDHIGGIDLLSSYWKDIPVFIGAKEAYKLGDPNGNLTTYFGFSATVARIPCELSDGKEFEVAGLRFKVLETPGHACGHVVYLLETQERPILFSGDLIFAGSIGRSDFPDGNFATLINSIATKIIPLPSETLIYPGHGPSTTLQNEKRFNPYFSKEYLV